MRNELWRTGSRLRGVATIEANSRHGSGRGILSREHGKTKRISEIQVRHLPGRAPPTDLSLRRGFSLATHAIADKVGEGTRPMRANRTCESHRNAIERSVARDREGPPPPSRAPGDPLR